MFKKISLFLSLAIFVLPVVGIAQSIGLEGGLNYSKVVVDGNSGSSSEINLDRRLGPNVGLRFEFPVGGATFIESGIKYSQKGYKASSSTRISDTIYNGEVVNKFNYVEVPLLLKFKTDSTSGGLLLKFGPYLGYATGGEYKIESEGLSGSDVQQGDLQFGSNENENDYRALDLGAVISLGIQFNSFEINAAYIPGLTNISFSESDEYKVRNQALKASIILWL